MDDLWVCILFTQRVLCRGWGWGGPVSMGSLGGLGGDHWNCAYAPLVSTMELYILLFSIAICAGLGSICEDSIV